MLGMIAHRGPDEAGVVADTRAAIGAVRLSIMDLAHGHQPMADPSGRLWIAYNGEIYNGPELRAELSALGYPFRTTCDTEVALAAWSVWGPEAADRFDGGYAFAVYDRATGTLDLVRDRYGKRPLFWRRVEGGIAFGSEIKVFLADPSQRLQWNRAALASIFAKWTPTGAETPFEGIAQLEPGSVLRASPEGIREIRRFGGWPAATARAVEEPADAVGRTRAVLTDAVRKRLRSDVETGVLLSGGLDSAILSALTQAQSTRSVRAFSLTFANTTFDESVDQEAVATRLGLQRTALCVGDADIAEAFRDALWHAEIPQFRTALAPIYRLAEHIRAHDIKVVLSGEGADEVFLGYDIFRETRLRGAWPDLGSDARKASLARLYPYMPLFQGANLRALSGTIARSTGEPDDPLFSHRLRLANGRYAARLLADGASDALDPIRHAMSEAGLDAESPMVRAQWLEARTLMEGYLLSSQGDRMLFAHGVEPRNPFLARDVVELAMAMPETTLLTADGTEKALLKRAFGELLPPQIIDKPKQPYRAPDAQAFRHGSGFRDWVEEALSPEALAATGVLQEAETLAFVDGLRAKPTERISAREDQAFLLVLSVSLLTGMFIRGTQRPTRRIPLADVAVTLLDQEM